MVAELAIFLPLGGVFFQENSNNPRYSAASTETKLITLFNSLLSFGVAD